MLANLMFRLVVKKGDLRLIDYKNREYRFGDQSGPQVLIRLHSRWSGVKIFFNPKLGIGEAFTDGHLTIEEGCLLDFLTICVETRRFLETHPLWSKLETIARVWRYLNALNPVKRARRNVAHHYDLSGKLYDLFLDSDRQYSCAYFRNADQSLEEAQLDKKNHIAAKLLLDRPELRVLDIGSGWGGLGLYMARIADADVTGLTLSTEQHAISNERARKAGLERQARFKLEDYRLCEGEYDRIISVGMFEHVGPAHYKAFFRKAHDLLNDDGVMLLHSIGHAEPPTPTNPWITKYVFPGGYLPSLSEVLAAVEKSGLFVTDLEILRIHYAETLRQWRERFEAKHDEARALFDERFCRMWEFYLTSSEVCFRSDGLMVFQLQLAKSRDIVPICRDYMYKGEKRLQIKALAEEEHWKSA